MIRQATAIMLLLGTGAASASERLSAEPSVYGEGTANKAALTRVEAFADLYADNARIRVIFEFASDPEFAVGITQESGAYRILALNSSVRLSSLPANPQGAVQSCATPINVSLATRIIALWRTMLLRVRAEDRPELSGSGGWISHFSMPHEGRTLSGYDRMSQSETNTGLLEEIAYNMFNYCVVENKTGELQNLERNTARLEQRLR